MLTRFCHIILLFILVTSCDKTIGGATGTGSTAIVAVNVTTDKAAYKPNDNVTFTIDKSVPATAHVRYKYLGEVLSDATVNGTTWTWKAPATDYRGYMVEVYKMEGTEETILGTVGVDVSTEWTKFPRYGFLSLFPQMADADIKAVIDNLNRHHINGLQFYDWQYKHHQPLAGTVASPTPVYKDIINRDISFATVSKYITAAYNSNMKAMFYNLVYGAWKDAAADGVKDEWYAYTDNAHTTKDKISLPQPPFLSDIYVLDPSNVSWQNHLISENKKVYGALPFDGFHMDQVGNRGTRYKYDGTSLDLSQTFKPFIQAVKTDLPAKYNVMNAVNQYGQEGIASSPVDFVYSEVWEGNESYASLARIIKDNYAWSGNTKNTVLAAYMNYNLANNPGFFNTPGVIMTDAVTFAFGGSHLELGEHMLGKEYFPNNNLKMKDDLKLALVSYYDFLVGYENLLRDGGSFNTVSLTSADYKLKLNNWAPTQGQVSVVAKEVGNRQVMHLLNFINANTLEWRDNAGSQTTPSVVENARFSFTTTKTVKKIWYATPDKDNGASKTIAFTQSGNQINFNLPFLHYWDMIVVEY